METNRENLVPKGVLNPSKMSAMDTYTQRLLNFVQSPLWIVNIQNNQQVFSNDRGNSICDDITQLVCLDANDEEELKPLGAIIKSMALKGGGEVFCRFSIQDTAMKGVFVVTCHSEESPHLILVEGRNIKKWKHEELLKGLWKDLEHHLPSSSASIILYDLKSKKVVFQNEWSQQLLQQKDVFLPHVIDRSVVSDSLEKVMSGEKLQISAQIKLENGDTAQHFILLQKIIPSTITSEELLLCYEEDISSFVFPPTDGKMKKIESEFVALLGMSDLLVQAFLSKQQGTPLPFSPSPDYSTESLLKIINIFDLCKLEVESAKLDITEFDLFDTIEDCVEFSTSTTKKKSLEIATDLPMDLPRRVLGDSVRIKQILLNFICNAVKFSYPGGKILVRAKVESDKASYLVVLVEVIDEGEGISKEQMRDLFPEFGVVCHNYKNNKDIGIGLAVSKQLSELMGGSLGAHSKGGEGSTVWTRLVLQKAPPVVGTPSCPFKVPPPGVERMRTLLVGDSSRYEISILQKYLKEWELDPMVVPTGTATLELLSQNSQNSHNSQGAIELIFISSQISDLQPFKLLKAIEQLEYSHTSVPPQAFVLSSKKSIGDRFTTVPTPIRRGKLYHFLEKFAAKRHNFATKREDQSISEPTSPLPLTPSYTLSGSSATHEDEETPEGFSDINVLVVEDNAMAQVFASRILKKLGMRKVDTVVNGNEGVLAFQRGSYDLILMDCQMPELDGYSATKQIRELEKETGGHVIIMAVTAMTLQEDRDRCFQMGMDDFIGKPVTSQLMKQKISQWSKQIQITKEEGEFGGFNRLKPMNPKKSKNPTPFPRVGGALKERIALPKREWKVLSL